MNIKSKKLSFFGYRMFYENTKRLKMMKIETVNNKEIVISIDHHKYIKKNKNITSFMVNISKHYDNFECNAFFSINCNRIVYFSNFYYKLLSF